jgi:hypothetical protein
MRLQLILPRVEPSEMNLVLAEKRHPSRVRLLTPDNPKG